MRVLALPVILVLLVFFTFALPGCSSNEPRAAGPARQEAESIGMVTVLSTVKLAQIWGPPKEMADRIVFMLDAASLKAKLALLKDEGAESDYLLRGDVNATPLGDKIRLTYNWYVLNRQGKEVGRKSGFEIVDASNSTSDVWSGILDPSLQIIAQHGISAIISRS